MKRVAETCLRFGAQNVHIVPADFSELDSADKFASRVREILNDTVDFLILNHAWISARDWVEHLDDGNAHNYVRQMMETNFISYVNVVSSLLKYMESTSGKFSCPRQERERVLSTKWLHIPHPSMRFMVSLDLYVKT